MFFIAIRKVIGGSPLHGSGAVHRANFASGGVLLGFCVLAIGLDWCHAVIYEFTFDC